MFSYPLTFANYEEHVHHVQENQEFYRELLNQPIKVIDEETKKELEVQKRQNAELFEKFNELITAQNEKEREISKLRETLNDTKRLEELIEKKTGISVVNKGACDEKYVEIVLKEITDDKYFVDNSDGVRKMDVRLIPYIGDNVIGIECKDKGKVTKADIDKFRRDKVMNRFHRSVFLSTSPIPGILEKEDTVLQKDDELFICTNNPVFLGAVMKLFLSSLEDSKEESKDISIELFDNILSTYCEWQMSKKALMKMDKAFLRCMRLNPDFEEKLKGHIYFSAISKLRKGGDY